MASSNQASNISPEEIDEETSKKLRGDVVGNTLYSERFILKTLMKLSNLHWSPEIEDDLCNLWDMTQEKDVCEYLFGANFCAMACDSILKYDENRFIEIIVGIVSNLMVSDCKRALPEEEIQIILGTLNSNDPLILVQTMRFLNAYRYVDTDLKFVSEEVLDRITFILNYSTNEQLLRHALKTTTSLTDDLQIDVPLIKGDLLQATIVALQAISQDCFESDSVKGKSRFEEDTGEEQLNAAKYFIQIACNLSAYVSTTKCERLEDELMQHKNSFLAEVQKHLVYFCVEGNANELHDLVRFYLEALLYVLKALPITITIDLFVPVCKIAAIQLETHIIIELFCFVVSRFDVRKLKQDVEQIPIVQFKKVAEHVKKENYTYFFEFRNNLDDILTAIDC